MVLLQIILDIAQDRGGLGRITDPLAVLFCPVPILQP
jgi:hypothetical protein